MSAPAGPNAAQIEYWNGEVGARWVSYQDRLDAMLAPVSAALIAAAAIAPGARVLDIGCGCGATSLDAARAAGRSGHVLGLDISRPMLARARERAAALPGDAAAMEFVEGDAADFPFAGDRDIALSRFGVMFFDDPAAAFANIRTAMAPRGRLVFVCWRALGENPWALAPIAAALAHLPPQPAPDPQAPGPFAFADQARVHAILETAGWSGIAFRRLDVTAALGDTLEDALDQSFRIGPLARALGEVRDEAVRARIAQAVRGVLQGFQQTDGTITAPGACWIVSARA